jgi:flagellar protein FliO/FliZ
VEIESYMRFVVALVFVLALIGVLTALARRFGWGYRQPSMRGKKRRLSIVETMPVDAKRRLLLVRRDATEHLILLGAGPDVVVEAGIAATDFADILGDGETPAASPVDVS